jgi:putative N6-adenine-specific DNA methylase
MKMKLSCPCMFGLEGVLGDEARRLGFGNVAVTDGRVAFDGDFADLARANIQLRTAERVQIILGTFPAHSFEDLFQGVKAIQWENFIGKKDAFPVKGWSLNSKLHSVPDCQSIIKKAVVTRLSQVYHQSWFEETGSLHQIQFSIMKDMVTVMLDTSGPGLHKRGYRRNSNLAPIKETLAAGIVQLSRLRKDANVIEMIMQELIQFNDCKRAVA